MAAGAPNLRGWTLAGVDEAGLGPMLGPLCIGYAAVGETGAGAAAGSDTADAAHGLALLDTDLWKALAPLVTPDPSAGSRSRASPLVVCDSKKLHSASRGIAPLERNVLPFIGAVRGGIPATLAKYIGVGSAIPAAAWNKHPWYASGDVELPMAALADKVRIQSSQVAHGFAAAGLHLHDAGCLPVLESEFNRLVEAHGNKSDVDASAAASVMLKLWRKHPRLALVCDALGARQFYAETLRVLLAAPDVQVVSESPERSDYICRREFSGVQHTLCISFRTGGDASSMLVSLASMCAKYARELCMELFNRHWCALQPGLKPTKGYVQDARRWLADTAPLRKKLQTPDALLIRSR
jgi:hypothetical protein